MSVWILAVVLILLVLSQKFVRDWFFHREVDVRKLEDPSTLELRSPVDGVVCYVKDGEAFESKKRWDEIRLMRPFDSSGYKQVGI